MDILVFKMQLFFLFLFIYLHFAESRLILRADGKTDTFNQFKRAFGGNPVEVPDCPGHDVKHITQLRDSFLRRPVFAFHIHVTPDTDRCSSDTNKQRNEVKIYGPSPDNLKGFQVHMHT